jgi:hypothetical protein
MQACRAGQAHAAPRTLSLACVHGLWQSLGHSPLVLGVVRLGLELRTPMQTAMSHGFHSMWLGRKTAERMVPLDDRQGLCHSPL